MTTRTLKELVRCVLRPPAELARALGVVPPERIFKHLHSRGEFTVSLPADHGSLRLMSWGNRVENELYWRGWVGHEPASMRWWAQAATQASCVLDIGANTGTFGFMAKALQPEATVHLFEPIARIANLAETNRAVSGLDVSVFQIAIADTEGNVPIYDPGGANAYSASLDPYFLSGSKVSEVVPVTTIDKHCSSHGIDPDLVKIDVEGLEGKVLLGAQNLLAQKRALILCEWLSNSKAHIDARELLIDLDYVCIDIEARQVIPLQDGRDYQQRNILLCPENKSKSVLEAGGLR